MVVGKYHSAVGAITYDIHAISLLKLHDDMG